MLISYGFVLALGLLKLLPISLPYCLHLCSDWLQMFSKLNTTSVLSVPTKALADVLL